jgi:predicted dehydrogenase
MLPQAVLAENHRATIGAVSGAIIATPHASHFEIARDYLEQGCHVLCEKPLTESREQGEELVALAANRGVTLSVNNTRRLFPASRKIRELIHSKALGDITRIKIHEGGPFSWPTASGFYFTSKRPQGVLLDRGAHLLDLICWWLGGKPDVLESRNDSLGGPESVAFTQLRLDECVCDVTLSWLTKLANKIEIQGTRGRISQSVYESTRLTVELDGTPPTLLSLTRASQAYGFYAHELIDNFVQVIAGEAKPVIPGQAVLDSLELIEQCYQLAQPFNMPWDFEYSLI